MKLKLIFVACIIGLFFLTVCTQNAPASQTEQSNFAVVPQKLVSTPIPPAEPKLLYIPKINVYTAIESVGLDNARRIETPVDFNNVGWYNLGFKPGEQGSAVIDGHLDTVTGAPAVFYHLSDLAKGDQIIVYDNNGKAYTFVVTKEENYPYNNAPIDEIINAKDKPRLNLITCSGTWNPSLHTYSDRTIIYSELQQ